MYNFDYLFNPTYSEGGTYSSEPTRYINFSLLFHPESAALQSSPILKNGKVSFGSVLYYKIPTIPGRKNSHDAQYFFQNTESSKSVLISYSPIIDESDIGISQSDLMAGLKVVQNNPAYLNSESQIAILNQVLASVILVAPASTPVSSNPLAAYTPTNVTAFMKQNTAQPTVQILWNSKYDSTLHQKNFTLERQTDGGNFQILAQPIDPMYEDMTIEGGKTYAYRVQTNFTSGSSPYSLLTSITVPISGDGVSNVTAETTTSTATIRFTTSGETQASLRYHTVDQLYNYTLVQDADSTFKTSHEIDIPNLKSGTIYKYYIEVGDKNGLYQKTSEFSFTTK